MKTNLIRCLIAVVSAFALAESHAENLLTNGSLGIWFMEAVTAPAL